jgi:DNA-directed RNA polymerase specialized sigma24 family protein
MSPAIVDAGSHPLHSDRELIAACMQEDERAWAALIDRYKRLIFSVPLRQGLPPQDAVDLFQAVCLDLAAALPQLTDSRPLARWLVANASQKAANWWRLRGGCPGHSDPDDAGTPPAPPRATLAHDLERDHTLRIAIDALPPGCRLMVQMLFFDMPARPCRDVIAQLRATGESGGIPHEQCLGRLQTELHRMGV